MMCLKSLRKSCESIDMLSVCLKNSISVQLIPINALTFNIRYDIIELIEQKGELIINTELMTIAQVAEYLQLSGKTIRRLINDGSLQAYKVARLRPQLVSF